MKKRYRLHYKYPSIFDYEHWYVEFCYEIVPFIWFQAKDEQGRALISLEKEVAQGWAKSHAHGLYKTIRENVKQKQKELHKNRFVYLTEEQLNG